ncbi:hypothetical protein [Consotaella aegiceratis]|uniref:hypothetical protein n=1 Tax=Consotaella aegiceratis TaxID=3097961 RepID=UPI002F41AD7A
MTDLDGRHEIEGERHGTRYDIVPSRRVRIDSLCSAADQPDDQNGCGEGNDDGQALDAAGPAFVQGGKAEKLDRQQDTEPHRRREPRAAVFDEIGRQRCETKPGDTGVDEEEPASPLVERISLKRLFEIGSKSQPKPPPTTIPGPITSVVWVAWVQEADPAASSIDGL